MIWEIRRLFRLQKTLKFGNSLPGKCSGEKAKDAAG